MPNDNCTSWPLHEWSKLAHMASKAEDLQAHLPAAAAVAIAVLLPRPLAALLALEASWQALHACPWPLAARKAAEGRGAATL